MGMVVTYRTPILQDPKSFEACMTMRGPNWGWGLGLPSQRSNLCLQIWDHEDFLVKKRSVRSLEALSLYPESQWGLDRETVCIGIMDPNNGEAAGKEHGSDGNWHCAWQVVQ